MTTVFIAEKPSVATAIAEVLGIVSKKQGHIQCKNDQIVTHGVGHMVSLAQPQEYNPAWKRWTWDHLPMRVSDFLYTPNEGTKAQLTIIKGLLKQAKCVVIATDAGREGELIARLILQYCKYRGPVKRFWNATLTPKDIRIALDNLLPGSAKEPLYEAGLARSHSDWDLGINGTRAVSLAANVPQQTFPVGRVQTPALAMVVRLVRAIKAFKPETYYEIEAEVQTIRGDKFKMIHSPPESARVKTLPAIQALVAQASEHVGACAVKKTSEKEAPPQPLSLPALQIAANKTYGFSAAVTLALAQTLYEKKVISYPRTDCRFLGTSQKEQVPEVLEAVCATFMGAVTQLYEVGITLRDSLFEDAKVVDHHGLTPTGLSAVLVGDELRIYTLICQYYLRAIAPDCLSDMTRVNLDANGVLFKASGRVITSAGWKSIKMVEEESPDPEDSTA